jgi:two-component system, cell cycle sensor histidine kinase and response regulator CckA
MSSPLTETILVVDDDPTVLKLCATILGMGGYNVIESSGGDEALRVFQEAGSEVQLALVDVMMPGINGVELCRRIESASPETKVVLMSGYDPGDVARLTGQEATLPIIWKPFRAESLLRMIENVLNAAAL